MKRLRWTLCLTLTIANLVLAQDTAVNSAPPDLVILKWEWTKQFASSFDRPPMRTVKDYDPSDMTRLPDRATPGEDPPIIYSYSLKIKNTGAKTMTGVVWEYIFTDPKSQKELGRRRFYRPHTEERRLKIQRNQSVTLNAKSSLPPTNVVRVQDIGKDEKSLYLERAEIKCVKYADGSWWKHPAARASDCEELESKSDEKGK